MHGQPTARNGTSFRDHIFHSSSLFCPMLPDASAAVHVIVSFIRSGEPGHCPKMECLPAKRGTATASRLPGNYIKNVKAFIVAPMTAHLP